MKPEDKARGVIDQMLRDAGWEVQDKEDLNLAASLGVAVTYYPIRPSSGLLPKLLG